MHFPTLFLTSLLATQTTSTPIANQVPLALTNKKWTLEGLTRKRNNDSTTCKWRFKVKDTTPSSSSSTSSSSSPTSSPTPFLPASSSPMTTAKLPTVRCSFNTTAKLGSDCGIEDFVDPVKCSRSHPSYHVTGAHERFGGYFMILVSNIDAGLRAYFLVDEALLESGAKIPPQTANVQNDMVPPQISMDEDEK
ncbi:hypothetical protein F5B17DRAFT_311082 [Nemania serpens]|nr:hypothetical protein F5B17DRAFT_311082 [Nemania serpens]